ncbi:MAG TPA: prepilin-type N-terminal cleavage/methylation domain-containing protein [Tepidisphaeraceae bacterium]|nr:prepilin-type N-terminal cleavage/methylation domain-containing protein [Tepidisphaeraceae bacterium]
MPYRHRGTSAVGRRPAFTLVELLVVIGIIALLISILLPSLSKAREQGNRVKCLSNMRQLGLAMQLYTGDNKGAVPRPSTATGQFEDWIYWQSARDPNEGRLVKYQGDGGTFNPELYRCPSDSDASGRTYKFSYTINEYISGHVGYNHPCRKLSSIRRASEIILFIDEASTSADDGCWAPQNYASQKVNVLSNRHDRGTETKDDPNLGKGNVLFVDGHSDWIERSLSLDERNYNPDKQ